MIVTLRKHLQNVVDWGKPSSKFMQITQISLGDYEWCFIMFTILGRYLAEIPRCRVFYKHANHQLHTNYRHSEFMNNVIYYCKINHLKLQVEFVGIYINHQKWNLILSCCHAPLYYFLWVFYFYLYNLLCWIICKQTPKKNLKPSFCLLVGLFSGIKITLPFRIFCSPGGNPFSPAFTTPTPRWEMFGNGSWRP